MHIIYIYYNNFLDIKKQLKYQTSLGLVYVTFLVMAAEEDIMMHDHSSEIRGSCLMKLTSEML